MTYDDIIRMAKEAGMEPEEGDGDIVWWVMTSDIERMARIAFAAGAAAEREKFCSDLRGLHDVYSLQSISAIRARGHHD